MQVFQVDIRWTDDDGSEKNVTIDATTFRVFVQQQADGEFEDSLVVLGDTTDCGDETLVTTGAHFDSLTGGVEAEMGPDFSHVLCESFTNS